MQAKTIVLIGALLASVSCPLAQAGADGSFDLVTYNVRGLPEIPGFVEDRTAQMAEIAPRLEALHLQVDVLLLLQELFDAGYYNTLTDEQVVSYAHITAKDTGGPQGIGDGLNRLSDFPISDFTRVTWNDCFGTFGANGSDCDTNKGFSHSRIELEAGVFLDVYNVHADAGQDAGSQAARRANIDQLSAAIEANATAANAVIVAGDTNSFYTRETDDNVSVLLTANGLMDAWVEMVNGGTVPSPGPDIDGDCDTTPSTSGCELKDKIFYRSGTDLTLTPTLYAVLKDEFHDDVLGPFDGQLSDHYAVSTSFSYLPEPLSGLQGLVALGVLAVLRRRR